MKKNIFRVAAVGAVAALLATMAPMAHAATTPTYDATTDAPIYMMDNTTGTGISSGTQLDWNYTNGIVLTANPVPADLGDLSWATLPGAAGAVDTIAFISAPGSERTPSAWKQWGGFQGNPNPGIILPTVYPVVINQGAPAATKAAGGTYSMGIALTDSSVLGSTHVVKAYYTTINVDAGTGTWTFAEKPSAVVITNTDVATTTTIAASPASLTAGSSTTLTATVSASKSVSGNVQFFEGTTSLGTVALSGGSATKSVSVGIAGTHTYTATFIANTVSTGATTTDTFLTSSSTTGATVTWTPGVTPAVPNAPSENALNSSTANGASVAYDSTAHKAILTVNASNNGKTVNTFVYSTPTFLGSLVVSATGTITVDLSTMAAGAHKLVITDPTTGDVIAWASFTKADAAISPSISKTINADVASAASNPSDGEFSIIDTSGSNVVNLTNPALVNGASVVSGQLGTFKVTDLRQVSKQGWDLKTTVAQFVKGTDTIENSALGIAPKIVSQAGTGATAPVLGTATVSGSAVYPWNFASLAAGSFSGVSVYNADLVFTAPAAKPAGTYTSTLTLTLISK